MSNPQQKISASARRCPDTVRSGGSLLLPDNADARTRFLYALTQSARKQTTMVSTTRPKMRARLTQAAIAWIYGRDSLNHYRPIVRAEFCQGDMLAEARMLNDAGYYVAAAATARSMLEKKMRRAVGLSYSGDKSLNGKVPNQLSDMLYKQGVWPEDLHRRYNKVMGKLNGFIHHNPTERRLVLSALNTSQVIAEKLDVLILYAGN